MHFPHRGSPPIHTVPCRVCLFSWLSSLLAALIPLFGLLLSNPLALLWRWHHVFPLSRLLAVPLFFYFTSCPIGPYHEHRLALVSFS